MVRLEGRQAITKTGDREIRALIDGQRADLIVGTRCTLAPELWLRRACDPPFGPVFARHSALRAAHRRGASSRHPDRRARRGRPGARRAARRRHRPSVDPRARRGRRSAGRARCRRAVHLGGRAGVWRSRSARRPTPIASVPDGNPYRGLAAFESAHASLFFGRRGENPRAGASRAERGVRRRRRDSGTGKSSLLPGGRLAVARRQRRLVAGRRRAGAPSGALARGRRWRGG